MSTTKLIGRVRPRIVLLIAGAAILAALVSACASAVDDSTDSEAGQASSGTLTIAATAAPLSLDPTLSGNGLPQIWYPNLTYAPLIQRLPNGKTVPGLATSWEYSKDRLSFVMNLRKGVEFSDGEPLDAAAVVSWLKHYKAKGLLTQWLENVTGISATGPLQVTLKLSSPSPLLPYGLDQDGMAGDVVGPKGLASPAKLGTTTDGAGPYMLDPSQTIANSQYVYVKNPNYYEPAAQHYSKVVVKVIGDENSILAALNAGEVQVAEGVATNAASAKSAGLDIDAAPSAMVGAYIGDVEGKIVPALGDPKVRQALSYAVDRSEITKALYGTYAEPTVQGVPDGISGHVPGLEEQFPYDPEKAKELLAKAGYPNGFGFTLLEQPSVDSGDLLAQALVAAWKEIGVDVTIKTTPSFGAYVSLVKSQKYPATTYKFQYSVQLVESLQLINDPALYNWMGFSDPTALSLIKKQLAYEVGSPQGTKAAEEANSYMTQNGNLVVVSSTDAVLFTDGSVQGVENVAYPWPDPTEWTPAG